MTLHKLTPLRRDTRVHYAGDVAEARINREAWAEEVGRLIMAEFGGNRSRFADVTGIGYKTVGRWLKQEVDVSEESVRAVARALHIVPMDLLMRAGYYQLTDISAPPPPTRAQVASDEALRLIEESEFPPRIKARMRMRLTEMRERRAASEVEERTHGCLTFAHGQVPDGRDVPQPPRQLPPATRQVIAGWIIAGIFLALLVVGIVREVLAG